MTNLLSTIPSEDSLSIGGVEFTPTSLIIPDGIPFDDWESLGQSLQAMRRSIHWWLGDWLRFGEAKFGQKYAQAMNDTPFAYQTLANDVWVAAAIEPSRRREKLTFAHHAVIAALPPAEQDEWLDAAEREGWSSRQLWAEARNAPLRLIPLYDGVGELHRYHPYEHWTVRLPMGTELEAQEGDKVRVRVTEGT